MLGPADLRSGHQVTKEVQCQIQISIIFMSLSHPQFLTDFLQTFKMRLVHQSVQHIILFYIAGMRSAGGHNFVMLSLGENIQIAPIAKILEMAASFHHFCASIGQYVTIRG